MQEKFSVIINFQIRKAKPMLARSNLKTPIIESVKEVWGTSTGRKWKKTDLVVE